MQCAWLNCFNSYKSTHPEMVLPSIQDFLALAEVRAVFKTPSAVPLSEESFGVMVVLIENWRKKATLEIADILKLPAKRNNSHRKNAVPQDLRLKTLELAITVFGCSVCLKRSRNTESLDYAPAEYMHYPWVMAHPCVTNEQINHALICPYEDSGNTWKRLSDRSAAKVKTITDCNGLDGDDTREASKEYWGCMFCRGSGVEPPPCSLNVARRHILYTAKTPLSSGPLSPGDSYFIPAASVCVKRKFSTVHWIEADSLANWSILFA
ncbi:hypothetical protein BD410DRAFT_804714 [Rickenella mellea]|uniref:Uncharacterized protein n=1 Tax=Rickenella mellea TaxID=50990 RepID=A0A4Y7Q0G0_9AGAM|nr:hypothetical protein BD410DRAFT_804714 [Rickenella mellea]